MVTIPEAKEFLRKLKKETEDKWRVAEYRRKWEEELGKEEGQSEDEVVEDTSEKSGVQNEEDEDEGGDEVAKDTPDGSEDQDEDKKDDGNWSHIGDLNEHEKANDDSLE